MDIPNSNEEAASFHYSDADGDGQISIEDARQRWRNYGLSNRRIEDVWQSVAQHGPGGSKGIAFKTFQKAFQEHWRPIEQEGMDRYQKIKTIGRGAHGVVRLVKTQEGAHAVMKKVDLTGLGEKQRHAAMQEIQLLYRLEHQSIISYHEAFVYEGHLMIAMDFAAGGDLQGRIAAQRKSGAPFPEPMVYEWFTQVLMALEFIHGQKVVHRDLKAGNVFLTDAGRIKLGDFGIARVLGGTGEMASTVVGTPYYLAPEIIEGKAYSTPADMWSAGVLLFEIASLQLPFQATNMPALMLRIVFRKMEPMPEHLSSTIRELVEMMLELAPEHRPSASQLLELDVISSVCRVLTAPPPPSPWRSHRVSPTRAEPGSIDGRQKHRVLSPMSSPTSRGSSLLGSPQSPLDRNNQGWNHKQPLPSLQVEVDSSNSLEASSSLLSSNTTMIPAAHPRETFSELPLPSPGSSELTESFGDFHVASSGPGDSAALMEVHELQHRLIDELGETLFQRALGQSKAQLYQLLGASHSGSIPGLLELDALMKQCAHTMSIRSSETSSHELLLALEDYLASSVMSSSVATNSVVSGSALTNGPIATDLATTLTSSPTNQAATREPFPAHPCTQEPKHPSRARMNRTSVAAKCVQCGAQYVPGSEVDGECVYHPGRFIRGGMMKWMCCKKRSLDAPGCTSGAHSNETGEHQVDKPPSDDMPDLLLPAPPSTLVRDQMSIQRSAVGRVAAPDRFTRTCSKPRSPPAALPPQGSRSPPGPSRALAPGDQPIRGRDRFGIGQQMERGEAGSHRTQTLQSPEDMREMLVARLGSDQFQRAYSAIQESMQNGTQAPVLTSVLMGIVGSEHMDCVATIRLLIALETTIAY